MKFDIAKVLAGYLSASAAALMTSIKLACFLGNQMMITFSGSFFR